MISFFWIPVIFIAGAVAILALISWSLYRWRKGK